MLSCGIFQDVYKRQAYEAAKGDAKVGTTGKGIGPTYTDKISRNGVRVGDILHDFDIKYAKAKARHEQILKSLNFTYDLAVAEKEWLEGIEYLKQFELVDSEHEINRLLDNEKSILAEGAQGTICLLYTSRMPSTSGNHKLFISSSDFKMNVVKMPDHSYYETLRNKLNWGEDKRNKKDRS